MRKSAPRKESISHVRKEKKREREREKNHALTRARFARELVRSICSRERAEFKINRNEETLVYSEFKRLLRGRLIVLN